MGCLERTSKAGLVCDVNGGIIGLGTCIRCFLGGKRD